jgi:hypothetical protein
MSEHTPTPWAADPDDREGYEWNVHIVEAARPHMRIAFTSNGPDSEANAAFIVKAVNAHDGLVEALEFIRDGFDNQDVNHVDYRVKVYQVALDALSRVGGSPK